MRRIASFDVVDNMAGRLPASVVQISFGLGCTAAVMSMRWTLNAFVTAAGPYVLTYPAILVATLFGRWRSGLTTLISSALLIWFYVLPAGRVSGSVSPADGPRFVIDLVAMLFILGLAEIFRRAICEANESLATVDERTRSLLAAEAALRRSQRAEAVAQLAGGLAHGFNNLLAGISGNLELLERRFDEGRADDARRYIEAARSATRRAASLTQRLLAFSRHQTLDPRPTDVNALATGMLELIRRAAGPAISVGLIGTPDLWSISVDPWQLEIALLNLCINARDAMAPTGGRLTIETENIDSSELADAAPSVVEGRYVVIRVSDTGVGMSPEIVARAFDPLFTTKPLGQGFGLGLSTVYDFVRQSNGQVRVDSTPGKGTTVSLFLPRADGPAEAMEEPASAAITSPGAATILVIDDEPTIRDCVVESLRENGYNTREAGDGPTGMQVLQSGKVDLLVVDIGLPGGMNGTQVADAARAEDADLKILFVTGYPQNVALNGEPLQKGADLIMKPFALTEFIDKVGALLGPRG
jgi:signal transduction histidine kinase/CheY-like chemotaxis protein